METMKIAKGDIVIFKPEYCDPGDGDHTFVALENSSEDRVLVVCTTTGLDIAPTQIVHLDMIAGTEKLGD